MKEKFSKFKFLILISLLVISTAATIKISDMVAASDLNDADLLTIVQGGLNKKVTFEITKSNVLTTVSNRFTLTNTFRNFTNYINTNYLVFGVAAGTNGIQTVTNNGVVTVSYTNSASGGISGIIASTNLLGTTNTGVVTLQVNPNITGVSNLTLLPMSGVTYSRGRTVYDSDNETLTFYNDEADFALQVGQEVVVRVYNSSGITITNGKAVYQNGLDVTTQLPTVTLARATNENTSQVVGLATHDIENNSIGYVTIIGAVRGLNTTAWSSSDILYLSANAAGELTNSPPAAGNWKVRVARVTRSNASTGILGVRIGTPVQVVANALVKRSIVTTTNRVTFSGLTYTTGQSTNFASTNGTPFLTNSFQATSTNNFLRMTVSSYFSANNTRTLALIVGGNTDTNAYYNQIAGTIASAGYTLPFHTTFTNRVESTNTVNYTLRLAVEGTTATLGVNRTTATDTPAGAQSMTYWTIEEIANNTQ